MTRENPKTGSGRTAAPTETASAAKKRLTNTPGGIPAKAGEELMDREAIIRRHIENGVSIADPATTFIAPDVTIGRGTVILPFVVI